MTYDYNFCHNFIITKGVKWVGLGWALLGWVYKTHLAIKTHLTNYF